jgi:lysophospholipase L1-like esterase
MKPYLSKIFVGVFALTAFSLLGCSSDSAPPGTGSGGGAGGEVAATGGLSAGGATTSPTSSGGALPSGGTPASGGLSQASTVSQGGSATGGAATSAAGQPATGGSAKGGSATGGAAGGESAIGGTAAGGSKTGGSKTGGSVAGGSVAGGGVTGGASGGISTGGAAPGGKTSNGGSPGGAGGRGSGGTIITGGSPGTSAGGAIVIAATGTYPVSAGTPTVYVAGDSTVSTYPAGAAGNQEGWGQRFQEFFDPNDVIVVNKAIGGESSKSFVDQKHLDDILAVIKPGDYLFAQWGINDRSVAGPDRATDPATTFRTYLKQYIDGARGKNAIPVLITPTPRHQYSGGVFGNGFPEYCTAIKAVGAETNTPVIDLQSMGLAYYTSIGDAKVTSTIILNGTDALHFNATGAYQMARMVALGVSALNIPISQYVIESKLSAH